MAFENFVNTAEAKAIGWTLFHSLWEGALAALVLLVVLMIVRSPRARYVWACAAMLAMLAGFGLTFWLAASGGNGGVPAPTLSVPLVPMATGRSSLNIPLRLRIEDVLPWLAPFWMAGVVFFQLRNFAGWMAAGNLRRRGVCQAPSPWPQRLQQLGSQLRISQPVTLLETCLADVPVVIGYLRPVILVPAGMISSMPPAQVEAILLHELAHIRRRDYLVNLLQAVVEGILFYHPATWWISSVIRTERENSCDDLVVTASGDVQQYTAALANLEHARQSVNQAALAATGGSLVKRIRRLLYQPEGLALGSFVSSGILMLALAGALAAWQSSTPSGTQAPPASQANASPYTKWLEEDVVYIIEAKERTAFLNLKTNEERDHFIEQFWLRRDPTPGTAANEFKEEHYRRIAYANQHFASSLPGWKTDRGRIYIMFGSPDEIESHPNGAPQRALPFDVWRYRQIKGVGTNVIMEFEDRDHNGEFHMTMDPNPEKGKFVPRP